MANVQVSSHEFVHVEQKVFNVAQKVIKQQVDVLSLIFKL